MGWVRWNPFPDGPIDIEIVHSTDGGISYSPVINPLSGATNPYDSGATKTCGRPALHGDIRYLPAPQLAVGPDGALHVVYVYGPGGGDVIDAFYRRSYDGGATWEPEMRLNDDGTTTDQFFPTVSVGANNNRVVSTWYDRRNNTTNNYMFDYYGRVSRDGGRNWNPSFRISDVSSPIYLDPSLATCYHGDYDQQVQVKGCIYIAWSDDRNWQIGHYDPDQGGR